MKYTGNPDDLEIHGSGYIKVDWPYGKRFTGDGRFGRVVWDGEILEDTIDEHVNPDRIVVSTRDNTGETIDQIQLTRFANPSGFESNGQNIFFSLTVQAQLLHRRRVRITAEIAMSCTSESPAEVEHQPVLFGLACIDSL